MNLEKLIIAEIGSVHDGSFGNAKKLIELAATCGADCVKFQTHIAEEETLPDAPNPDYFKDESRIDYFKRTSFTLDQWKDLKETAKINNVLFLSSPFSLKAVDLLNDIGAFGFKIPSGEVNNLPLIEKVASVGKPVFLSSGMSDWEEIDSAINLLNNCDLTVMQCSSSYPCPMEKVGLNIISEMKEKYKCNIGFSDHTNGFAAAISAVSLGANVIEKHFTFSKSMYGSDAKHSMEPNQFSIFCKEIKDVWTMIDNPVDKNDISPYYEMKKIFQKSIVAACNISENQKIKMEHLAFKKPGDGIPASDYKKLIGCKTLRDINKDEKLSKKDIAK